MTASPLATPLQRARALAPALQAASDEIERTRRIPQPLLGQLHDANLFRLLLPKSYGGEAVDPWVYFDAVAEVARHDGSVAWNLFVGNSSAQLAAYLEPEAARAIYAEPTSLVAWGPPNGTRLKQVPGGYRATGRWHYASGCRQATWMGVHDLVENEDGELRKHPDGRPYMLTLLFPVEQAEILDTWDTIGLRGTGSDSYDLHDVFVPETFSSTREDLSLRKEPAPLYAFTWSGLYAVGVAACATGMARGMLAALIELAKTKTPRGLSRLAESPSLQHQIARSEARLGSAEAFVVATLQDVRTRCGPVDAVEVPDRAAVRLACTHAIHSAIEIADFAYKQAGIDAIYPASVFQRRFRDIHTLSQQIQSRDAHYEAVGRVLLDLAPPVFW
ncbi:MAG: acyl-CoA dehydrogenase family protein [Alphaproteobacteria bacterium]